MSRLSQTAPWRSRLGGSIEPRPRGSGLTRFVLALAVLALPLLAQPPVAPTDEPTGPPNGENVSGYNIRQSFEAGYRWRTVGGNEGMYRSTVNYGDGIRLLASSLSVQSRDGHGHWFDQILLNTQGLGNDPYQFASLRIEKNGLYRYDLTWRLNDYFNPSLTIANGEHAMDTVRHMQDQDLILFPQGNFKIFMGYSRVTQTGPALSTIQLFDSRGDEYPLFVNVNDQQNEYRLGGEVKFWGFRLNAIHGWEDFKEDSPTVRVVAPQGNNPNDVNELDTFQAREPYHGTSPYWRVALFREGSLWAVNGRFTYVAGRRNFNLDELSTGFNRFGAAAQRQIVSFGNAQRPAATGNLTFSVFPTSWVTVTNQTSLYNIRMVGNSNFVQFDNGNPTTPILPFQYLGIETIANTTDAQFRVRPWLSIHGGYGFSSRRIASLQTAQVVGFPPAPDQEPIKQTNTLNAVTLGFQLRPMKPLTINVDGEIGRNDKPIYPISDRDYHAIRARLNYRARAFHVGAFGRIDYNTNSNSITSFASHTRQFGVDASWTGNSWFSIDASYSKLHLDTLGGLAYFAGVPAQNITTSSSYYVSNVHAGTLAARFAVGSRVDVSAGFSIVQDVGLNSACAPIAPPDSTQPANGICIVPTPLVGPGALIFSGAQTFPLRYLSPQAKVSFKIREKLRWNAGYQYYGYKEDVSTLQDYRANTGYTSLSWSF
jgi:hypothetical protein